MIHHTESLPMIKFVTTPYNKFRQQRERTITLGDIFLRTMQRTTPITWESHYLLLIIERHIELTLKMESPQQFPNKALFLLNTFPVANPLFSGLGPK